MTLLELKSYFENKVAESNEISSFLYGWVQEINDNPSNDYPLLMLTPPKQTDIDNRHKDYRTYLLKFWLMDLAASDKPVDRDTKWNELQLIRERFFENILENDPRTVEVGGSDAQFDDGWGVDGLVFIEYSMKLRTHRGE